MRALIECLRDGVPAPLTELRRLGRTLTQRAADVPAYFDRPATSNGPTEALNGRLDVRGHGKVPAGGHVRSPLVAK